MVQPIITPRMYDLEYWGKSSTNIDRINSRHYTDITEDELFRQGGPVGGLGVEQRYRSRVPGAVEPMNTVNDVSNDGYYGSNEMYYGNDTRRDFEHNIMPLYNNPNTNKNTIAPIYEAGNTKSYEIDNTDSNFFFHNK
jgi:hypothetical protein